MDVVCVPFLDVPCQSRGTLIFYSQAIFLLSFSKEKTFENFYGAGSYFFKASHQKE